MLKSGKVERLELYKDRNTQVFLSKFLSNEIKELEPVYDPQIGYHYPIVEAIVGDAEAAEEFLNKLFAAGVLERKLYDKVIYCPKCESPNVSVRYQCPYCKSFNIKRSALIEHVKCGYMDAEEKFVKGNRLICPKCQGELKKLDVDYRKAGMWCTCNDCGKSFDIPNVAHFCRSCHTNFVFEDAVIRDVYAYSLREEAKEEVAVGWVIIAPIRDFLVENGFKVESPAFLKGKSGANHMFDIVAYAGDSKKAMVMDVAVSTGDAISEQPVIALFAKMFDVAPEKAYLVAIPQINENGKRMAELYNIEVVEAQNQKEAVKALREKILAKS
ncbi:MAG: hypothetical protein QXM86_01515 [Candidatus Bathyarchaeia archaeon]